MKKLIIAVALGFAIFFLGFVFRVTKDISGAQDRLIESANVSDVTDKISTRLLISTPELSANWISNEFDDSDWEKISIPTYQIVKDRNYHEGNTAYYRIHIPKSAFNELEHLNNQASIALQYIYFSKLEIFINGKFYSENRPKNAVESIIVLPVVNGEDNLIAMKGKIETGDTGIDHRGKIILGRTAELNEVHRSAYKEMSVFQMVFIFCKGSVLFIFILIYLLMNVDRSFEKFLLFGFCTFVEELIAGDYLSSIMNFNSQVYLYNLVNIGAVVAVFVFFSDLLKRSLPKKTIILFCSLLSILSFALAADSLNSNFVVELSGFMKFWNFAMVFSMLFLIPEIYRQNKTLLLGLSITLSLYLWSAIFSSNVGLNMKAYGNLLLFFVVAYQTFVIFRREQDLLIIKNRQLLEQEKDVAIGKIASLLAHDVRKPLELTKIVVEKISSGDYDQDFLKSAKTDLDFSISSVNNQVNDIINYGRNSKIDLVETSFYKILSGSLKQVMTIHHGVDIKLDYQFQCTNKVLADESRLASALINLITNAVEAIRYIGKRSEGKIHFSTEKNVDNFVFRIFNDGPEIPDDVLKNMFQPLFTHGKVNGTGLGLSSVSKMINDHGGSILVRNIEGKGVEFSFELKISSSLDEIQANDFLASAMNYGYGQVSKDKEKTSHKFRLFVLDSDMKTEKYFQYLITKLPFNVELSFFVDKDIALESILKSRYDLYLIDLDFTINEISGFDFYNSYLSFLSLEVVFYTSVEHLVNDQAIPKVLAKPLSLKTISSMFSFIDSSRLKIFFVDDSKIIRGAWQNYHGKHNIDCYESPEEALKSLEVSRAGYDYFVLDYHFDNSQMNGKELAQKILTLVPQAKILIASSIDQKLVDFPSISKRDYEVRKLVF